MRHRIYPEGGRWHLAFLEGGTWKVHSSHDTRKEAYQAFLAA